VTRDCRVTRPGPRARFARAVTLAAAMLFVGVPAVALAGSGTPSAGAPAWLRTASALPLTAAQSAAPASVLLDEAETTFDADGRMQVHRIYAAKLNTREGREAAAIAQVYMTDGGRIRSITGWLIRPSGEVQALGDTFVIDAALAPNDVYNEARVRVLAAGDVEPGTVFGAEVTAEDRSPFLQMEWQLQVRWPVVSIRRSVRVPAGWTVTPAIFNHAGVEPARTEGLTTWTFTDLPAIPDESDAPPTAAIAPRLAVSARPPEGARGGPVVFADWSAVSAWLAAISDPQAVPDATIREKARELTATATTDAERIRAIAAWVQQVRYISVQMGLGRGGGYKPRPAPEVLAKNHGDCKDKATLMRSLLAAVGIRSYAVAAYSGDRDHIRETWPSPDQFNHAILAIVVPDALAVPQASVSHPIAGNLLFFDPTDPYTKPGSLPGMEEGSFVLVGLPAGGGLVRLPDSGPAAHSRARVTEGQIGANGAFAGTVSARTTGDRAAELRALVALGTPREQQDYLTRKIHAAMPGAHVSDTGVTDSDLYVDSRARVAVAGQAQVVAGDLMMVTPPFSTLDGMPALSAGARALPIVTDGLATSETLKLRVFAPFNVDELPEAVTIDAPFGIYRLRSRVEAGDVVVVERQFVLKRATIPAADTAALRRFLDAARAADTSPIVLKKSA
jgi:hypothetical protein